MNTTVEISTTRGVFRGAASHALKAIPAVSEMSNGRVGGKWHGQAMKATTPAR